IQCPADDGARALLASLREAQQRQPRLRVAARGTGPLVGRLGRTEIPAEAMQLSLLIMRGAHGRPLDRPTQPKARLTCLLQGVRPLPAKLQHLAAVDEALAAKRQKLGLGITP